MGAIRSFKRESNAFRFCKRCKHTFVCLSCDLSSFPSFRLHCPLQRLPYILRSAHFQWRGCCRSKQTLGKQTSKSMLGSLSSGCVRACVERGSWIGRCCILITSNVSRLPPISLKETEDGVSTNYIGDDDSFFWNQ